MDTQRIAAIAARLHALEAEKAALVEEMQTLLDGQRRGTRRRWASLETAILDITRKEPNTVYEADDISRLVGYPIQSVRSTLSRMAGKGVLHKDGRSGYFYPANTSQES